MKTTLPLSLLALLSAGVGDLVRAEPPQMQTDFRKTLSAAAKENKLGFILLGRPTCSICNHTKAMIRDGKIDVSSAEFVMADLNIDDTRTEAEFMRKYGREKWGDTLLRGRDRQPRQSPRQQQRPRLVIVSSTAIARTLLQSFCACAAFTSR